MPRVQLPNEIDEIMGFNMTDEMEKEPFDDDVEPHELVPEPSLAFLKQATDDDIVFAVQFDHMDDANHFRMLFEYIQMGFIDGSLSFTKEGIYYANINGIRTIGNEFFINGYDVSYIFNRNMERAVIGINLGAFAKVTKNVGKKHSLLLFYIKGETVLRYEILSMLVGGKSSHGRGTIPIKQVEYDGVELPTKGRRLVSVPISIFCSNCTILSNTTPVKYIRIVCYEEGFKLQAVNNSDELINTQPFYPPSFRLVHCTDGTSLEVNKNVANTSLGPQLLAINIDRIIMKWMRKMVNIPSISDRIRVYISTDSKHVIFECNVAKCGVMRTYLSQGVP